MAKRGQKSKSPALHLATGTDQPCRRKEQIVIPLHGEIQKPDWLKGEAGKIWDRKVKIYERRSQSVVGLEDALAHYCSLETHLIKQWENTNGPIMAEVRAYRIMAGEFFDTPASQLTRPKKTGSENKFDKHVRR